MIDPRDKFCQLVDELAVEVNELRKMADGNEAFMKQFGNNQQNTRYTKENK